ncbi:MAG: type II toxin-antitoxin system Phd/YefM family antitoxin [Deltaproteobacteria bacterium]|nr:type II toxin-antitoxin system Phd/YefM family antitoxin [Deltaproteobacteria bacterium]
MIELHPSFLPAKGKKQFAVLPYEEFLALQQLVEDLEDLRELRAAKEDEGEADVLTLDEVRRELDLDADR